MGSRPGIFLFLGLLLLSAEQASSNPCMLMVDYGNPACNEDRASFYFNWAHQECKKFYYHGCEGNKNRFDAEWQCEHTCKFRGICKLSPAKMKCDDYRPKYYYDWIQDKCYQAAIFTCLWNRNNFRTREACEHACKIKL